MTSSTPSHHEDVPFVIDIARRLPLRNNRGTRSCSYLGSPDRFATEWEGILEVAAA